MHLLMRGALMGAAAAALPVVTAVPAQAAPLDHTVHHAKPAVLQANWYWAKSTDAADSATVGTPLQGESEPSNVPAGDLSVSYVNGTNKESYVAFDQNLLSSVSRVRAFRVTLFLDQSSPQLDTPVQPPALRACLPVRTWSSGAGDDIAQKPADNCAHAAKGRYDAKAQSYTFLIPRFAQDWVDDVNTGVAITYDPAAATTPFQVNFRGSKSVKAAMTFVPAVIDKPTGSTGSGSGGSGAGTSGGSTGGASTGSGGSGSTGSGGTGDSGSPALGSGSSPGLSSGSSGPGSGASGTPPVVAGGSTGSSSAASATPPTALRPVPPASSLPDAPFWIAALGLALLLGLVHLVTQDTQTLPAGRGRRRSRLDQVLSERTGSRRMTTSLTLSPAAARSSGSVPRSTS
jgi:hypothetical protein